MTKCEHCGFEQPETSYELLDYCAECGRNLCDACMAKGCCGHIPAHSGMTEDADE